METLNDKLRKKKKLQELQKMATPANKSTQNQQVYSNISDDRKLNMTTERVKLKFNQIMRDTQRTAQNFGYGVSSSFKNAMSYLDASTNKWSEGYRQQNAMQNRIKQQEEMRNPKATNSQQPLNIDIRNNQKGTANLIDKKDTTSVIGKAIEKEVVKDEQKIQQNIETAETKVGKKLAELAPSMAQSTTGMALGAVNPYLGLAYFQSSAGGAYTREAKAKGMNDEQAYTYGTIMGALESATEYVGNKLTIGVGKKFFGEGIEEGFKAFGLDVAENALEEAVMEPLSEYVTQLTGGQANWDNMGQRILEAGFNGALSSIIMGGVSAGVGSATKLIDKIQNGERVTQEEIAQTLKDINKSEEVDIEKLLVDSFKFTADDLLLNTTARDRVYSKLDSMASDISKNEYNAFKPMSDEEYEQAIMKNKEFLKQRQQVALPYTEKAKNQFSQEFEGSAQKYGIDVDNYSVKLAKEFTDRANLQLVFEETTEKNALAVYKDGKVIINANAIKNNPDKVIQNIVLHESLHGKSGSKEFADLTKTVLGFVESKGEYKKARADLEGIYGKAYKGRPDFNALIDEEVVTNTLGEYFGTEEKLNELINYIDDRKTLQKLYDFVKDIVNSLTGYKDQEQYFRRVERQLAKALQSDYVAKSESNRYLFTGRHSRLDNSQTFKQAEQMWKDGVSDAEILEKTGWFYDTEDGTGKWKYEIDDSKSKLLLNESRTKLLEKSKKGLTLQDVFENEELYKAYPELADYKVEFINDKDSGLNGAFYKNGKRIVLNLAIYDYSKTRNYLESYINNRKDLDSFFGDKAEEKYQEFKNEYDNLDDTQVNLEAKMTLIHEIQHAIQDIEGFAEGSTPNEWKVKKLDVLKALNDRYEYTKNIKDTIYEKYHKRHKNIQDKLSNGEITRKEYLEESDKIFKESDNDTDYQWWSAKANQQLKTLRTIDEEWEYDLYTHTKGEQDARKSAERANMTFEERRKSLPTADKDYSKNYDYTVPSPKDVLGLRNEESSSFSLQKNFDVTGNKEFENAKTLFYRKRDDGKFVVQLADASGNIVSDYIFKDKASATKTLGKDIAEHIAINAEEINNEIYLTSDEKAKETDYMMSHRPTESGVDASNLSDMWRGFYEHPEWYVDTRKAYSKESLNVLNKIKNNPDAEITIYRATPGNKINEGDWVTLSKKYAEFHNETQLDGKGNILELKVKAKDVQFPGDDVNEFGYFPQLEVVKDNKGRTLSKEQQEYFKDSKVRDENGNLLEVYHGTEADFTVFNKDFIGYNGTQYGKGFYYSSRPEIAKQYEKGNGKTLKGYLKIDNPLSMTEKTMSLDTFTDLVHRINKQTNGMFYKKLQDKLSLSSTKQTISLEEWQQLVKDFGKENYISTWSDETRADKGTSSIYNLCSNDFDVYRSLINSLGMEDTQKFIEEVQNRFSNKVNVEENIKELYDLFNYDNEILIRFDKYSDEMRDEYKFDVYKTVEDMGYDGLISKDMFITFNSNQFKNVDNTKPTKDPDIRYSLSQDTRKNIEAKIDRYSRIVEEMQQEGKNSDEWAPYANEILRLQDQLEETRYSYQSNGEWQKFVEKYFSSEGTKTKLGDIKLPTKAVTMKDFNSLLDNAINIPKADKKALKSELKGVKLTSESLKEFEETVKAMDNLYKEESNRILNQTKSFEEIRPNYNKYMKYNTDYDKGALEKAKQTVPTNKQGRRTKDQWLNVAKQIGIEIANKTNQEIEEIAYRTWQDERPNQKSSLNRQGEKFVKFDANEWINTIFNTVKEQRDKLSLDTNLPQKQTKALPERKIVDEVYIDEIAEGKTRKHLQSIFESDQVGEVGKEVAKELYKTNTYTPISNATTIADTNDYIARTGVEDAYVGFRNKLKSNEKITLQDVALGERLIQIYSQNGDYEKVNGLIQDVAILGTELGQQVQAFNLIKRASPEGQLQYLQKLLDRTNIKENTNLKLTPEQIKLISESKNKKELEDNISKVAVQLASEIPLKTSDKIRAWRYLSMLGNPKTHIKNLGANIFMNLTQGVKNKVAGGIESVVGMFNPNMERTKTIKIATKEQKQFAKQDAEEMANLIDAGGKYDIKNIIQNSKKQFDNKYIDAVAKFNSDLLDKGDKIFLKLAYKQALQGYMRANNLKASDMTGATLEKARQYASLQAQEATFHEFNVVAKHLSEIENKGGIVGGVMSAILPFKKTPMNIAKAGFDYSAVGLAKTLTYDMYQLATKTQVLKDKLKSGKINQKQYKTDSSKLVTKSIDNMAKGLTGTSIALLGYFLAQKGLLKAGNDDEGDEFEEKLGSQEYAIKFGDNTYTLDWISPSAIPLFTGATIYQLITGETDDKQSAVNSALTGVSKAFEPMTEMSMLQGLTSAITSYEQGSSNMFFDLGASMITSYIGQFLPTAFGQVARTIDPYERDTSSTKKGIEGKVDRFARQSINKLPGASMMLPTKSDVWGNEVKRPENILQRGLEVGVLPWNRKEITQDRTDRELLDVFDASGENVLPGVPSKDLTINKEKHRLTTDEYNKAKKDFGKTTKNIFDNLVTTNEYQGLSEFGKAKAISDVYSYAKEKIKVDYAKQIGEEYDANNLYNTVNRLQKENADVSAYFEFKGKLEDVDRTNGEDNVKQKEKLEYLYNMNTDAKTKAIIYEDTFGNNDENYQNLKVLTNDNVSIEDYLNYKTTDIKGIDDPRSIIKGKTISGSKKTVLNNFLDNSGFSGIEEMYLYGTQYTFNSTQKSQFSAYLNQMGISSEEQYEIYKKLKSIEELENGAIRWK